MSLLLLFAPQSEAPPVPPPVVADDHVGLTSRDLGVWQAFIRREPPDTHATISGDSTGAHFATLRLVPRTSIAGDSSRQHVAALACVAHATANGSASGGNESSARVEILPAVIADRRRIEANNAAIIFSFLSRQNRSKQP